MQCRKTRRSNFECIILDWWCLDLWLNLLPTEGALPVQVTCQCQPCSWAPAGAVQPLCWAGFGLQPWEAQLLGTGWELQLFVSGVFCKQDIFVTQKHKIALFRVYIELWSYTKSPWHKAQYTVTSNQWFHSKFWFRMVQSQIRILFLTRLFTLLPESVKLVE